ncbi:translation initiation factor IF-2 N-terminal domain-containing protein, partial [Flavobacteriales bacterium]|nr:translation initiation factor IF-2 N-terminal domain-containing protein [Flavobacteriales bacterium]
MSGVSQRLSKVAKEFNVGVDTILDFLESKGIDNLNRNSKISPETYEVLVDEYQPDKKVKAEAKELKKAEDDLKPKKEVEVVRVETPKMGGLKIVSKVDIKSPKVEEEKKKEEPVAVVVEKEEEPQVIEAVSEEKVKEVKEEVEEKKKEEPVSKPPIP